MDWKTALVDREELYNELSVKKEELAKKKAEFDKQNEDLTLGITTLNNALQDLEVSIRNAAVEAYKTDPAKNKSVYEDKIKIRINTKYEYDDVSALEWAKQHGVCIALDVKAFKDICKSENNRPEFVVVTEEPTATLCSMPF